jgi:hypothetical protein
LHLGNFIGVIIEELAEDLAALVAVLFIYDAGVARIVCGDLENVFPIFRHNKHSLINKKVEKIIKNFYLYV